MIINKLLEHSTIDPKVRAEIVAIMRDAKTKVQKLIEGSGEPKLLEVNQFDARSLNQILGENAELRRELQQMWEWSHDAEDYNGSALNCKGLIIDGQCVGTRDAPCQFPRPEILEGKSC